MNIGPSNQLVTPNDHPTTFLSKTIMKMFKPLRFPCHLNPYPLDCLKYLLWFSGENQVSAKRHLESFENFVDRFEIVHDDVIMRMFSKSLFRDDSIWFKGLRVDSISSWIELSNAFLKHWGENKSLDLYLTDFYALKREEYKALHVLNRRFYNIYHDMPLEMWPTEIAAMIYYVMGLHL